MSGWRFRVKRSQPGITAAQTCILLINRGMRLCLLLSVVVGAACSRSSDYARLAGPTMGTQYRISAKCPQSREVLARAVGEELQTVNAQMSTYDPASELSRFNAATVDQWHTVSSDLLGVIDAAGVLHTMSSGAFDVTVGPLVNLWGFGPTDSQDTTPDEEQINNARERVGHGYLSRRQSPGALRKEKDIYLDLSAIAKGHGVDRVAQRLQSLNCTDLMVDIGGEVRVAGSNPNGQYWRIGIEVPDPELIGSVQRVLALSNLAVATSGDYRNFIDLAGKRLSHTIDPRTGYPVQHSLASVSVVHTSAMWADGLATMLNVLGPDKGFALAEREGLAVLFLIRTQTGFEERYTAPMSRHLVSQ